MNAIIIRIDNLNEPHTPAGLDRCRCDSLDCRRGAKLRIVWRDLSPAVRWTSSSLHCPLHGYEIASENGAADMIPTGMARTF